MASRIQAFDLFAASRVYTLKAVVGGLQVATCLQIITLTCLRGHVMFLTLAHHFKHDGQETMAVYCLETCKFQ